jgi:DNA-binding transcriptional MerR regulator
LQKSPSDPACRPRRLRRTFNPAALEQLALISLGQEAGLSLDEIA